MEHPLRERTYDQRLVEAAIKSIQSPEDTREQEFEPDRNTLQHCEVIRHWIRNMTVQNSQCAEVNILIRYNLMYIMAIN